MFSSVVPASCIYLKVRSRSRGSAAVRVLSVPPRIFVPVDAQTTRKASSAERPRKKPDCGYLSEFGEQSQYVYENKGSLVAQTAGSAVCGISWGGPRTANKAVRATEKIEGTKRECL